MTMKSITFILGIIMLAIFAFTSCTDDNDVYPSNDKFVRIDQTSLSIVVGEKFKVTATTDEANADSYKLTWSVLDTDIATATDADNNTGVITAVAAGTTVIKVETIDGRLVYFADLTVSEEERSVKVLTIGSGISNDATISYLHDIAKNEGLPLVIGNLSSAGASLEDHMKNITENQGVYQYNRIAADGGLNTQNNQLLKTVIKSENWDYIAIEEALPLSGKLEGYQTYLPQILEYIKEQATNPDVKYILHQPWAYAQNALEEAFADYDNDQIQMFNAIVNATSRAKEFAQIDITIPSGTAIQNGRTSYVAESILRDNTYLNMNIGRFITACTWFEALFGKDLTTSSYKSDNLSNFDTHLAKEAAHSAIIAPKNITDLIDYKEQGPNEFVLECPIYIDFGPIESAAPFNNYRFPTDAMLGNLKDEQGNATAFQLGVEERFTGVLERGLENLLGFPKTASEDMFFSDGITIPVSSFKMSYLNRDQKYTFVFYGHINDRLTETEFHVIGKNEGVGYVVNDDNLNRVAIIQDIEPTDEGTITIKLQPGPNNTQWAKFFGVNAMIITPEGYELLLP